MLNNVGELGYLIYCSIVLDDSLLHEGAGMLSQAMGAGNSFKRANHIKLRPIITNPRCLNQQ
jgi:hypothetical protein